MAPKTQDIFYEMGFSSHQGTQREVNEDNYCTLHREDDSTGPRALIGVSDGVGGFSLGEIASKITINNLEKFFKGGEFDQMFEEAEYLEPPRVIQELYTRINHVIRSLMEKENRQVGCTLVSGFFYNDDVYIGNVGNSRAYMIRDGSIRKQTEEKGDPLASVSLSAANTGESLKEAANAAYVNSLGSDLSIAADIKHMKAKEGDIFLFCSDGLYTQVSETDILDIAAVSPNMQKFVTELIKKANDNGGADNVTVVAVKITTPRGFFGSPRKKSSPFNLPVILAVLFLTGLLIFGSFYVFKRISQKNSKTDINTGFRINDLQGRKNIYNSISVETDLPVRIMEINGKGNQVTETYQTFPLEGDASQIRLLPDMAKYKPALYILTLEAQERDLQVVQGRTNLIELKGNRITVQITHGSRVDYSIKQDRGGNKFQVSVNNLGTPFTIKMETQENIYVNLKPDEQSAAVTQSPSPGASSPSPSPSGTSEILLTPPSPEKTKKGPGGEPFQYKLE